MIHRVFANKPSFHSVTFDVGVNIILAEKSRSSSDKDTRNGVGKTTLLEIINFCLGAAANKGKGLIIEDLSGWIFSIEITLLNNRVQVSRKIDDPTLIYVCGENKDWPIPEDYTELDGTHIYTVERWNLLLGEALFSLNAHMTINKDTPKLRGMLSYFLRLGFNSYSDPFVLPRKAGKGRDKVNVAYLIGLDWEFLAKLREFAEQLADIAALDRGIRSGILQGTASSLDEFALKCHQLEVATELGRQALASYKVQPEYEDLQKEADALTSEIHELSNLNMVVRRKLRRYDMAMNEAQVEDVERIRKIYAKMGVVFSNQVVKTLDEVKRFHDAVIRNRSEFLAEEYVRLSNELVMREKEIEDRINLRASKLSFLETNGALSEIERLRAEHAKKQEQLERCRQWQKDLIRLKEKQHEILLQREELIAAANKDFKVRQEILNYMAREFTVLTQRLYSTGGTLEVSVGEDGYDYKIDLARRDSDGVKRMGIFCFDLSLLKHQRSLDRRIDFLIHDTPIFDSVDARQRARALELADEISREIGGQYICPMNSDKIPTNEFSTEFNFESHVKIRLSDASVSDNLLGISFER